MQKKVSIEQLARMCQTEFADLHKENAAMRKEIGDTREEVAAKFSAMHNQLDAVLQVVKNLREDFNTFQRWSASQDRELTALRVRIERIEKKVGMRKS